MSNYRILEILDKNGTIIIDSGTRFLPTKFVVQQILDADYSTRAYKDLKEFDTVHEARFYKRNLDLEYGDGIVVE